MVRSGVLYLPGIVDEYGIAGVKEGPIVCIEGILPLQLALFRHCIIPYDLAPVVNFLHCCLQCPAIHMVGFSDLALCNCVIPYDLAPAVDALHGCLRSPALHREEVSGP